MTRRARIDAVDALYHIVVRGIERRKIFCDDVDLNSFVSREMIVKLKSKSPSYPDLSEDQPYFVLGIEADDYRILNDAGKPYLYPPGLFDMIDSRKPNDWVTEIGEDGERYSYPEPLNKVGFFEDFFDQKYEQTSMFWHLVNQRLADAG